MPHPRADDVIAAVAGRQYGVITSAQPHAAGLTDSGVYKRVRAGRLHRLYRGVYAVGHNRLSSEGQWMAAVLAAGEGAVLSHLSAAVHWKIWRRRVTTIAVVVPGHRRARRGFKVHGARHLDPQDTTTHQGIPITSGSAGTRSDGEDRFLAEWQGSQPLVNTKLHGIEVDFHWPEHRLVVEVDGPGHARPRTQADDQRRDRELGRAGVTVLRLPSGHGR